MYLRAIFLMHIFSNIRFNYIFFFFSLKETDVSEVLVKESEENTLSKSPIHLKKKGTDIFYDSKKLRLDTVD